MRGTRQTQTVGLRCDQCHSVSRAAFELIQQETPSNRSLNFVGPGSQALPNKDAL